MKRIVSIIAVAFLVGCAPLSHVKERDLQLVELREELHRYKVASDSLHSSTIETCTVNFNRERTRYTRVSERRDYWFLQYTAQTRNVDTLYMQINDLENDLEKCNN